MTVVPHAGVVDCQSGSGSVRLEEFDASHPFAQLQGSDNIIEFTTQRCAILRIVIEESYMLHASLRVSHVAIIHVSPVTMYKGGAPPLLLELQP